MIRKKSWEEFRNNGLLFIVNQFLHVFGYAIVYDIDDNGVLKDIYPARVKFRGFGQFQTENGYKQISKYMRENAEELEKDCLE